MAVFTKQFLSETVFLTLVIFFLAKKLSVTPLGFHIEAIPGS